MAHLDDTSGRVILFHTLSNIKSCVLVPLEVYKKECGGEAGRVRMVSEFSQDSQNVQNIFSEHSHSQHSQMTPARQVVGVWQAASRMRQSSTWGPVALPL
jgi:hypothetical protein